MKVERLYNPLTLGMRVAAICPRNPNLVRAIAISNPLNWKGKPYAHEWALVEAYFGFDERNRLLDQKYARDLSFVLNWISSLHIEDFIKNIKPDRMPPQFLNKRQEILSQIKNIQENSLESRTSLDMFLTDSVFRLGDKGIFNIDNFLDRNVNV